MVMPKANVDLDVEVVLAGVKGREDFCVLKDEVAAERSHNECKGFMRVEEVVFAADMGKIVFGVGFQAGGADGKSGDDELIFADESFLEGDLADVEIVVGQGDFEI